MTEPLNTIPALNLALLILKLVQEKDSKSMKDNSTYLTENVQ